MEKKQNTFQILSSINIDGIAKEVQGRKYLPWAKAVSLVKSIYPSAKFTVLENEKGWNYFTDGRTAWVKVQVDIGDQHLVESLPVTGTGHKCITLEAITSNDINRAQKRCLVKALALCGLGINLYNGEEFGTSYEANNTLKEAIGVQETEDNVLKEEQETHSRYVSEIAKASGVGTSEVPAERVLAGTSSLSPEDMDWALNVEFEFNYPAAENKTFADIMQMSEKDLGCTFESLLKSCIKQGDTYASCRAAKIIMENLAA